MRDIYSYIGHRVLTFETLLRGELTPLLRDQLQHAVTIYNDVLNRPSSEIYRYLDELNNLYSEIDDHWRKIFSNMFTKARLFRGMLLLEQFIGARLLEDYGNEPHAVHERTLKLAKCKGHPEDRKTLAHQEGWEEDQLDGIYETNVIFPLEELMLDRAHIERKMDAAVSRHGQPGSDIQPLIHRCDWESLAATLVKDRDLTTRIFPDHGNTKGSHEKVMRGISQIQAKYFSELASASMFTVSAQASAMSAELALTHPVGLPFHSGLAMSQEEEDRGGVIGKVYGTIARGIMGLASQNSVEAAFSYSDLHHGDQSYNFKSKKSE